MDSNARDAFSHWIWTSLVSDCWVRTHPVAPTEVFNGHIYASMLATIAARLQNGWGLYHQKLPQRECRRHSHCLKSWMLTLRTTARVDQIAFIVQSSSGLSPRMGPAVPLLRRNHRHSVLTGSLPKAHSFLGWAQKRRMFSIKNKLNGQWWPLQLCAKLFLIGMKTGKLVGLDSGSEMSG